MCASRLRRSSVSIVNLDRKKQMISPKMTTARASPIATSSAMTVYGPQPVCASPVRLSKNSRFASATAFGTTMKASVRSTSMLP